MITREQIEKLIKVKLNGSDKFLVEIALQPVNKIVIYIDGDSSVSINDCQELSRYIESSLDRDYEDYELTVSSAGMDRPIKMLRQYKKRIGKELDVITLSGEKFSGILARADDQSIELEHPVRNPKKEKPKPNTVIPFEKIKTAKTVITFGKSS